MPRHCDSTPGSGGLPQLIEGCRSGPFTCGVVQPHPVQFQGNHGGVNWNAEPSSTRRWAICSSHQRVGGKFRLRIAIPRRQGGAREAGNRSSDGPIRGYRALPLQGRGDNMMCSSRRGGR